MKKIINSKIFLSIVFCIALVLTFIMVLHHEIWLDEGQAWLLASDLDIIGLFKAMKYEAHSCLWHLVLHPFARLHFPVITLNIISFILYASSSFIILFKMKKNIVIRILLVFSPFFFYNLGVISRCYSLISLLLCLIYLIYDKRKEHPFLYANLLGLLANTHVIMDGFVGMAALIFLIEYLKDLKKINKKEFFSVIGIFIFYLLILLIQVIPSINNCYFFNINNENLLSIDKINTFLYSYLHIDNYIHKIILLSIVTIITIVITFFNDVKKGLIYLSFVVLFILVHLSWPIIVSERISIFIFVFIILNIDNKHKLANIFIVLLIISVFLSNYKEVFRDFNNRYSDSLNASKYLNKKIQNGSLLIFYNSFAHPSLISYINKDVYYYNINTGTKTRYIVWNSKQKKYIFQNKLYDFLEENRKIYKHIYILTGDFYDSNVFTNIRSDNFLYGCLEDMQIIKRLYITDNSYNTIYENIESYAIYEYLGNSP